MRTANRVAGRIAAPVVRAAATATSIDSLTLLGWHRIGEADDGLTTTFDDFRRQLDLLDDWGATVLPLEEAHRLLQEGRLPERSLVLTFDDGYASVLERAWPELQRRGLPASLFAVSGYLDAAARFPWDAGHPDADLVRLADRRQLLEAAAGGLHVGSHTVSHRWLPSLDRGEVCTELTRSRADLEDLLQRPIRSFAYPMGGWSREIRDEVAAAGYDVAITVERGRNRAGQHALSLRRAFAFDRPDDVRLQLDGAYTWMRPLERWRARRAPRW